MITDVFDSVKFSEIENDYDTIRINKIHATAALYEALIFCPEGVLMLSAPQFFDGLAAVDKKWRSVIFDLIKKGFVKIALYNTPNGNGGIHNIKEYLSKFVAPKKFIYSSRPHLSKMLAEGDRFIEEHTKAVWDHILNRSPKPSLGTDPISEELKDLISFFDEFFNCVGNDSDIYSIQNSQYVSYKDYINNSFCDAKKISDFNPYVLFNLFAIKRRDEFLYSLNNCANRTELNDFLDENPFNIDSETIRDIKRIYEVLYNKFSLITFNNSKIHVPVIEGEDRRRYLNMLVSASNVNHPNKYKYENTELIRKATRNITALSLDDVIGMHNEIKELKDLERIPWNDALNRYKDNLRRTSELEFDDNFYTMVVSDSSKNSKYLFTSVDVENALDAAIKNVFLDNIDNLLQEDSYI